MRVKIDRQHRRLSADRHAGLHRQYRHARRRLSHPCDARRRHGGVHPHQSGAALSRQRPAGGGLCDRAHGRSRRRPDRHRSGRAAPQATTSRPTPCRSRPALTFTYDSGEFEKSMDLALKLADFAGFDDARARNCASAASCAASASPTPSSAPAAGELRGRRDPLRPLRHRHAVLRQRHPGPGPRDHVQADRVRPPRRSIPDDVHYVQGDTDQVFFGEGTGGSRSATLGGSAFDIAAEKIIAKAKAIAAHLLKVDVDDVNFADGMFSSAEDQPDPHHQGGRAGRGQPGEAAEGHGVGLTPPRSTRRAVQNFPNGCHVCELEIDPETGVGRDRALQRGRRRRHRAQSAAAARARSSAASRRASGRS